MICPNCKNEVKENAKFCTKCGFHLISEAVAAEEVKKEEKKPVCSCCGAELKQGAKFCTKCGTAVMQPNTSSAEKKEAPLPDEKEMPIKEMPEKEMPVKEKTPKKSGSEKQVTKIIIILFIVCIIAAAAIIGYLVWESSQTDDKGIDSKKTDTEEVTEEISTDYSYTDDADTDNEAQAADIDAEALFEASDILLETAYEQMENDSEIIMAMENFTSAISGYVDAAAEAGSMELASDRVEAAYNGYFEAVSRHVEMMNASTLSGAIYAQIMTELEAVVELGEDLSDKGFNADAETVRALMDDFDASYREDIINTFDEFTTREAWSRTEAWNLMKDTDSVYDAEDLNDPIRLRYCYALAWWTQKQIETELASGTITEKGAAIKIAGLIEAMDYNPMMTDYYIQYMNNSGEDCSSVEEAYNEILEFIRDEQGIELGVDIDLAHFWYYNDISEPSQGVQDSYENGVLPEVREFIRERMSYAEFIK